MSVADTASARASLAGIPIGATHLGEGQSTFRVWAPWAVRPSVEVYSPERRTLQLESTGDGYWQLTADAPPGTRYKYRLADDTVLPDPASRLQPEGVHGVSEVIDSEFSWTDAGWRGLPVEDYVLYELHVGTFTPEGTFDSAIPMLSYLRDTGITAVELMPVAQFPGSRNWGYDGTYPFAVQTSYGGVDGLRRFVNAAHAIGLAVVLDVVYNHLGPEGNYLGQFGPYFTDRYHTPWGQAVNFDGQESHAVRQFFVQNALYWVRDFHIDGLRLDAVHAIFDSSETHILSEIGSSVHAFSQQAGRIVNVIAESDLNDSRLVRPVSSGGFGLDAQWSDDFHHALHAVLTGERSGYYEDFGKVQDLAAALSSGFVYSGQYSAYRGRCHGTTCDDVPGSSFVVCSQNHDQVGNRMLGERLGHLLGLEDLKLTAGVLLLSPFVPLLFMGQEYGETAPFLYFVSHTDPDLVRAVREGRKREFSAFAWRGEVPDPQDEATFLRSKLNHEFRQSGWHAALFRFYKRLLELRRMEPALRRPDRARTVVEVAGGGHTILMRRTADERDVLCVFHFGSAAEECSLPALSGAWTKLLDSSEPEWQGPGSEVPERPADPSVPITLRPKQCLVMAAL